MTLEDIILRVFATILLIHITILIYQRIRDDLEEIRKENEQEHKNSELKAQRGKE